MKREAAAGHRAWCLRNTVEGSPGGGGWGLFRGLVSPPVFGLRTRQEVAAGRWGDKQVTRAFSKATKWRVSLYIFPTKKYNLFFDAGSTPLVTWLFFKKKKKEKAALSLLFKCFILAVTWRGILANVGGCFFFFFYLVMGNVPSMGHSRPDEYVSIRISLGFLGSACLRFVPCANCSMSNGVINGRSRIVAARTMINVLMNEPVDR